MSVEIHHPSETLIDVPEVRLGISIGGLFLTTAATVPLHLPGAVPVGALLAQTALCAYLVERWWASCMLGTAGWALATGFAVNGLGELTLTTLDLARLGAFLLGAIACRWLAGRGTMSALRATTRRRDAGGEAQRAAARVGVRRRGGRTCGGRGMSYPAPRHP